jgi:hypothetical protein
VDKNPFDVKNSIYNYRIIQNSRAIFASQENLPNSFVELIFFPTAWATRQGRYYFGDSLRSTDRPRPQRNAPITEVPPY